MDNTLIQAIEILKKGGVVIFPTDTAFGIGCRMDDREAVDRLFALRKRPRTQATPILVGSIAMATKYYTHVTSVMNELMQTYWPGALTIIGSCDPAVIYEPLRGGGSTIGLRMPNHPDLLSIIAAVGVPILGPSANFHGAKTPFRNEDLDPELLRLVDYVYPGMCTAGDVSTVVDCTTDPYIVKRQGAIVL